MSIFEGPGAEAPEDTGNDDAGYDDADDAQPSDDGPAYDDDGQALPVQIDSYDFSNYANDDNGVLLEGYASEAAKHGLSQEGATGLIDWVRGQAAEENARGIEQDRASKRAAHEALRETYQGYEYQQTTVAIESYLRQQPQVVQDALRHVVAYDTDGLQWLAKLARSPQVERNTGSSGETEPEALRRMQGDHGSAYWKGPQAARLQALARDRIAADNGNAQPRVPSYPAAINAEIAREERFMKEHRAEYNKDNARQERLRALYRARG
jgi:hypothetical protein